MVAKNKGLIAGLALGVGAAGAAAAGIGLTLPQTQAYAQPVPQQSGPTRVAPMGAPASFADIFQRVSPAVVSIVVTTKVKPSEMAQMEGIPFPFNQLPQFQNRRGGRGGQATPRGRNGGSDNDDNNDDDDAPEAQAAGSGFFISADGYIVTNNHVVEDATKITVTLPDQREFDAKVVGRDEASDLAVIKVQGANFPFVTFETQAKPRVGDWVLAVGNPLQLGGTATAGIVSSIGRDLPQQGGYPTGFLQIDAPINRGNSGGPTFDVYGRVIGVNSAIYSQTGGSIGIGFAVPADVADSITRQLMAGKTIQRGYLGATIQALDTERAQVLGLPLAQGAFIADVVPTGPGARAGLRPGDVVLTFNGEKVLNANALTRAVGQTHAGDTFHLGILREGRRMDIAVRSGVRPSETALNASLNGQGDNDVTGSGAAPSTSRPTDLGVTVSVLTPAIRQAAGIGANVSGVVVESTRSGSDASRKITKGDVIVQANQQPVRTPAELIAVLAQAKKEGRPGVLLLINRRGTNAGVPVKFDDRPRSGGGGADE
ncbi:MAG: trypsin-like peptidase domain-containing protein [Caulobacteraceae bacterium]|nr:trypsin-like peptidase domain-containing protein [Caulobacter sp.]